MDLSTVEIRVVGALVEKQLTTPQYYPLTLNALVTACNQTSNRNPVVAYDDHTVSEALASLRERGLTRIVHSVHNRAAKYRHVVDEVWRLEERELAVLGVLLLRGPQTAGELRTRSERAVASTLEEVESTLESLAVRDEPLVRRLPRRPGQKEERWVHLLAGEPDVDSFDEPAAQPSRATGGGERVAALEDEVRALREELDAVKAEVAELRALFD